MAMRWNVVTLMLALLLCGGCSQPAPKTPLEAAQAQFKSGQWDVVIDACAQILASDPNNSEAVSLRARSLGALGRYDEAMVDLNRWVELAPSDSEPLYHRAIAYEKLGELELAEADSRAAKKDDPLHKTAYPYEISSVSSSRTTPLRTKLDESESPDLNDTADDEDKDESDLDSMFGSTSSGRKARKEAAEDADREEAIWDRISDRLERKGPADTHEVDARSMLGLDSKSSGKVNRKDALERVAEQLFIPDDTPEFERAPEIAPPPTRPLISSALPTDPYGNPYIPGNQPLGTNPNAGFSYGHNGVPGRPYGEPYGVQRYNVPSYSAQPYAVQPGFTPGQATVSTALPPQLQGRLGTNAGVTQYGGTMYPQSGVGTAQRYPGTAYGPDGVPIQLPNSNMLAPAVPYGPPSHRNARAPVSSALPQQYLHQIQQSRSTTYGP